VTARVIDLNADVGEDPAALADGREARLLSVVTSINVACGGHAGDAASMQALVALAHAHGVALGAHPSYPDRAGFGRQVLDMDPRALADAIARQVRALAAIAANAGVTLRHVKPHGALYNVAARDRAVAAAIATAVAPWRGRVALVGLAGSLMLEVWRDAGFSTVGEAFADRRYEPDGSLRSRQHPDAVLTDPEAAARQALDIVVNGVITAADGTQVPIAARTLCVHGDTPGAVAIATAVRAALAAHGVTVRA